MNNRPLRNIHTSKSFVNENKTNKLASEYYHRARRNLVLVSSLLFGFSLAGLKLTSYDPHSVNIEISKYTDTKISFSNPELLPYILVIIIIYLLYRLTIEWYHCSEIIRKYAVSRVDYFVSLSIGILAIISYLIQALTKIKLADIFNLNLLIAIILGILIGEIWGIIYSNIKPRVKLKTRVKRAIIVFTIISLILLIISIKLILGTNYPNISTIFVLVLFVISFLFFGASGVPEIIERIIIEILKKGLKKGPLRKNEKEI